MGARPIEEIEYAGGQPQFEREGKEENEICHITRPPRARRNVEQRSPRGRNREKS